MKKIETGVSGLEEFSLARPTTHYTSYRSIQQLRQLLLLGVVTTIVTPFLMNIESSGSPEEDRKESVSNPTVSLPSDFNRLAISEGILIQPALALSPSVQTEGEIDRVVGSSRGGQRSNNDVNPAKTATATPVPEVIIAPCSYGELIAKYFPPSEWKVACEVMEAESRYDTLAINYNSDGSIDRGLLQINSRHLGLVGGNAQRLFDQETNIRIGGDLFKETEDAGSEGWLHWSVCKAKVKCW